MRLLLVVFVMFSASAFAQTDTTAIKFQGKQQPELISGYKPNRIIVGIKNHQHGIDRKIRLTADQSIVVSNSVINEVGTAFTNVYNIKNRLAGIKLGNQRKRGINLTSNVGLKGWEANAVGSFSKKRGSTFNLNYQYSVENMLMQGLGHRLRFVTNF